MALQVPESHRDLIDRPYNAALTTLMPDGQLQITPVWFNQENDLFFVNTMKGFLKEKNMRANPRVSLLVYDPSNPLHNVEIRGTVVEMTENGALEHLDALTQLYLGKPDARFFGDSVPAENESHYTPVRVAISPTRIRVEG